MAAVKKTKKTTTSKAKAKAKAKSKVKAATSKTTTNKSKTSKSKTSKTASKSAPKKTTKTVAKKSTIKKSKTTTKVSTSKGVDFIADVIKQAAKAQKAAQTQIKTLAKQLTALDKEQAQLTKKQHTAKGKAWQTIEGKVTKLKTQSAVVRTALLNAENGEDKIATLAEYAAQLNSRATPSSYLPTTYATPSKPTLVKTDASPLTSKAAKNNKPQQDDFLDEDDYPDEEDLDLEDDNEEIGFVFGDDDELQDDEMMR